MWLWWLPALAVLRISVALKPVNSTKTWNINHSPIHLAKTWLKVDVAQSCLTVCNPMHYIARGILQARNTGVGSLSLLHGISATQGLNQVSYTAGGFFTCWATREAKTWETGTDLLLMKKFHHSNETQLSRWNSYVLLQIFCDYEINFSRMSCQLYH